MPWPGGERCHFGNCEAIHGRRVVIHDPDHGTSSRFVCAQHEGLIAEAVRMNIPVCVTPLEINGTVATGGTVWINTIADFWFGKRRLA